MIIPLPTQIVAEPNRSTFKGRMKGAPYYCIYNVGSYTFAPFKVIWPEMSSEFCAAVVSNANVPLQGSKPYIPDHKVFFVDFQNEHDAYFLCGLLNSSIAKELIEAHNISTQMGDVLKHINLPAFNKASKKHRELADKVKMAHLEHDKEKRKGIIDQVVLLADRIITATITRRLKQPES